MENKKKHKKLVKTLMRIGDVKNEFPDVEGVSVGAINSSYQKIRVENVCRRLNLKPICYLWEEDQISLLDSMISAGIEAIIIKVAALGLTSKHLGMTIKEIRPVLHNLSEKYGNHVCGEGGEFETFVLDCPLYLKRICTEYDVVHHSKNPIAPVAFLKLNKIVCVNK